VDGSQRIKLRNAMFLSVHELGSQVSNLGGRTPFQSLKGVPNSKVEADDLFLLPVVVVSEAE
jgi:hypothetical protein